MRLSGSYSAMASALHMSTKHERLDIVPSFDPVWLPSTDEVGHWEQLVMLGLSLGLWHREVLTGN